jgi:transcriptional regulator with XRE-family HTH domain
MSIHEAIKARRQALEWSQERLAEEVSRLEGLSKPLAWQTVQQWENGVSAPARKRLPFVAAALGLTMEELNIRAANQEYPSAVAHLLRPDGITLSSPVIDRGVLKMISLPKAFKVAAHDDSMSPRLKAGQLAEFETGLEIRPGDGVLVTDTDGEPCIRRCRKVRGQWEAYAEDADNHLPFPIEPSQVLAVLVGVHARWG